MTLSLIHPTRWVISFLYFYNLVVLNQVYYIIYNPTTGTVTYDSDGSGAGQGVQIAQLGVNLPLTNADFVVI